MGMLPVEYFVLILQFQQPTDRHVVAVPVKQSTISIKQTITALADDHMNLTQRVSTHIGQLLCKRVSRGVTFGESSLTNSQLFTNLRNKQMKKIHRTGHCILE